MKQPKVLIACLHCERKAHNQLIPHESIVNQTYDNKEIYYNIETANYEEKFGHLIQSMVYSATDGSETKFEVDTWQFNSSWWKKPAFDQDQQRLVPICMARNMCIEAAISIDCEYIMFIDSDMTCEPDTLERFVQTAQEYNRPIVFGLVPGRNDHKHVFYQFPHTHEFLELGNDVVELGFGNIGFVLIHKSIFQKIRFRRGPDIKTGDWQSDDPNFVSDAVHALGMPWPILDRKIKATHKDEDVIPFKDGAQY